MTRQVLALAMLAATALAACSDDPPTVEPGPSVTFATAPEDTATSPTSATGGTTSATDSAAPATMPLAEGSVAFTTVAAGLDRPLDLAWRDGDDTLYVVQQAGLVLPLRDGVVGDPVLDLSAAVSGGNEQGLLGLAFHPTEPYAYVDYTDRNGDTVIAEYGLADDGQWGDSPRTVLTIEQPYSNHNGGNIAFGPDGFLYIGMGDGGSGGDPERRSLNVGELLGKILRIDPRPSGGQSYGVPADNPFVGVADARPEIWSVGVRNPWRFSFDRETGDLWIGDVGQNEWEEIDLARAADGAGRGVNFGWSAFEATHRFNDDQSPDGATPPVHEYQHGDDGCSVSGGTVYRGTAMPSLVGWYVFGDYCSGRVWALHTAPGESTTVLLLGITGGVSAIRPGPDGELYVLAFGAGEVQRLDAA